MPDNQFEEIFSFFRSFDLRIWPIVLFIWLIQWACCALSQRLSTRNSNQKPLSVFEMAWQVLRLQLLQSRELQMTVNASYKFSLSVFGFFQCYLLLGLFSSFLLAALIRPPIKQEEPLSFLINGLNSGQYRFIG